MFHLLLTPANNYRFYDTDTCSISAGGYPRVYDAYHDFSNFSCKIKLSLAFRILATSPDYASFPQLYPEFFI